MSFESTILPVLYLQEYPGIEPLFEQRASQNLKNRR